MKLYQLAPLASVLALTMACTQNKTENKDSHIQDAGAEIHNFQIPDNQNNAYTFQKELSPGTYQAKSIRLTRIEKGGKYNGSKWSFIHTFNTPGSPKNGDPVTKRADWVNADETIGSAVHEQVPMRLQVLDDGALDYSETRYHGASMSSDGSWNWVSSDSESGYDIAYLLSKNVISKKKQKELETSEKVTDTTLSVEDSEGNVVDRENNRVQKVVSLTGTQIAAVKKLSDTSFVLIHYVVHPDVAEIYTEVEYTK